MKRKSQQFICCSLFTFRTYKLESHWSAAVTIISPPHRIEWRTLNIIARSPLCFFASYTRLREHVPAQPADQCMSCWILNASMRIRQQNILCRVAVLVLQGSPCVSRRILFRLFLFFRVLSGSHYSHITDVRTNSPPLSFAYEVDTRMGL